MHAPIKVGPTTSKFIKKYVGYEKRCECGGGKQALLAPHPTPMPRAWYYTTVTIFQVLVMMTTRCKATALCR